MLSYEAKRGAWSSGCELSYVSISPIFSIASIVSDVSDVYDVSIVSIVSTEH